MQFGLFETTFCIILIVFFVRLPALIRAWFSGRAELEKVRKDKSS